MNFVFNLLVGVVGGAILFVILAALARVVSRVFSWALNSEIPEGARRKVGDVVGAIVAPVLFFTGVAAAVAVIAPPPQSVTYDTIAIADDASSWSRNVTWLGLKTGWTETKVTNRFFYTKAIVSEGENAVYLVGFPGEGKWYQTSQNAYENL